MPDNVAQSTSNNISGSGYNTRQRWRGSDSAEKWSRTEADRGRWGMASSESSKLPLNHILSAPPIPLTWGDCPEPPRFNDSIATIGVVTSDFMTTDGGDVRGLGCRGVGPGAVRIHDVVPHRVSRLLDRTCQLSRGAGRALAVDRTRGLHQPVQLLAENFRHRLRHGRGVGPRG